MKAITVEPKKPGTAKLMDIPEPGVHEGSVLVEAIAVGVCGTDVEIVEGKYGWAPQGQQHLVLGHESLGRVIDPAHRVDLKKAIWSLASFAVLILYLVRIVPLGNGTCAATDCILNGASKRSTDSCRSAGGSSLNMP